MSISLKKIGQRIVTKIKKLNISQIQLAETIGISDRTLSKIEHGFDMRLSLLLAICDALDIDVGQVLADGDNKALTSLSENDKQQIRDHLQAISKLLPD